MRNNNKENNNHLRSAKKKNDEIKKQLDFGFVPKKTQQEGLHLHFYDFVVC